MGQETVVSERQPKLCLVILVAILFVAFGLRLHGLSRRSLWFDESIEFWMAAVPLNEVHRAVAEATHDPPLYSYLLHFWKTLGIDEFCLRFPSLVFSLIGLAGFMRLGSVAGNRTIAIIGGFLLSIGAADIRYGQETGQYSLMVCLVIFNLLFLFRTLKDDSWRPWVLWAFTALLSTYSHYGTVIVIFTTSGTFALLNLLKRDWTAIRRQAICSLIVAALILPLFFFVVLEQMGRLGAVRLPIDLRLFLTTSSQIVAFQWMGNQVLTDWPWPVIPPWVAWVPSAVAAGWALRHNRSIVGPPMLLLISWIGYYLISRSGFYFFSGTRHSLLLAPLLILTIATGVASLARASKIASSVVLLPIVIVCLLVPRERQEDLRSITSYWQAHRDPQEVSYIYYGAAPGFRYQLDLSHGKIPSLPRHWYLECWEGRTIPACTSDGTFYGAWTRTLSPAENAKSLLQTVGYWPGRMWLVFSHTSESERDGLLDELAADYRTVERMLAENASIFLLERR